MAINDKGGPKDTVEFNVSGTATLTSSPGGAILNKTLWTLYDYVEIDKEDFILEIKAPTHPDTYRYVVTFMATNNADGLESASVTATVIVKVAAPTIPSDTTAPTLTYKLSPATPDGENGWYKSPVDVSFTYSDEEGGSGLNAAPKPTNYTLSTDGTHAPKTVSVTDNAGNTTSVTVPEIKIDTTAPTLTHTLDPEVPNGNNGWYTSPVKVTFIADDLLSGLNPEPKLDDFTISTEGSTPQKTYTVKDMAGNSASTTVPQIKIDRTAPILTHTISPENPNGKNGWYTSSVTVEFTASDEGSEIDPLSKPGDFTISDDRIIPEETYTVEDMAGNVGETTVPEIKVDKTAPVVTISIPERDAVYKLNEFVAPEWNSNDATSGIDLDNTFSDSKVLDTSSVGEKTFTVTATDMAGNKTVETVTYKVIYDFDGFFQPIEMGKDMLNSAKAGSSIPIKFSLNGYQGMDILLGTPKANTYTIVNGQVEKVEVPIMTAGKSGLSYDLATDQYTYVWKTDKDWSGTNKQLAVTLNDNTIHYANFTFK